MSVVFVCLLFWLFTFYCSNVEKYVCSWFCIEFGFAAASALDFALGNDREDLKVSALILAKKEFYLTTECGLCTHASRRWKG